MKDPTCTCVLSGVFLGEPPCRDTVNPPQGARWAAFQSLFYNKTIFYRTFLISDVPNGTLREPRSSMRSLPAWSEVKFPSWPLQTWRGRGVWVRGAEMGPAQWGPNSLYAHVFFFFSLFSLFFKHSKPVPASELLPLLFLYREQSLIQIVA